MITFSRLLRTLALLVLLGGSTALHATHLIGGNLGYTYLGETSPGSQVYRYQVYMQFYMNCGDDSNWATLAELLATNGGVMPVGVYTQDPLAPNANKLQYTIANLALLDSSLITPDLPSGCDVGDGLCTKLGLLQGTVDLPLNFGGYHLYFQMNARNITISNLFDPNNTGIGFYAFIPPPLLPNSSPIWLGDPTPLLCINDTSTFVNSATDPDGDQLIFSFETPYNSVDNGGGIIPPPGLLPNTIPVVAYVPGFSVTLPFGAGGYAFINGATGLTQYQPTLQGNYVVAVEVKEYRNGVLIGRTRRDLQLQAVVCPPNDAPELTGIQTTSYTVQAGDPLCFDIAFLDPNADSLQLTASGTIFDGALFNPPATIIAPVTGNGTVASTFCWDTDCAQAQDQPYLFSVSVSDNGCPPRTLDVIYQVFVQGFAGPTAITGAAQACTGQLGSVYSTGSIGGAVYDWTVVGGTIMTGQGTNSITVDWGASGSGSVQVSATNTQGCVSTPIIIPVTIVPLPATFAGADTTICAGTSILLGGAPTGPAGSGYLWSPAAGLNNAGSANPTATPTSTTDYIVQVTNSGCANRDTIHVAVNDPQVDAGTDATLCAGGSVQLNASGSGIFSWSPATGLSATDIADPIANPGLTTSYSVTITDAIGCTDLDSILVLVNALPVVEAGADQTPCPNTSVTLGGSPTGPAGSTFVWSPSTGLNNTSAANPTLSATIDGTYMVVVTDTNQCVNSDTLNVILLPLPNVDAGPDLTVCAGDSVQLQGSGTGALLWTPAFGLNDPTLPDPISTPESTITYTLTVTDANTCTNSDQAIVTVNVLPSANAGVDRTICAGDSVAIGTAGPGAFTWSPAIGLSATDVATPMASPAVTTTYYVSLTDTLTCNAQDSVVVSVFTPGQAGIDGFTSACSSGAAFDLFTLLDGTPDAGGIWLGPTLVPHGSMFDPAIDVSGVYTYIASAGTPCPDSAAVQVTVSTPNVQFTGDNTICAGDTTQITGSGGTDYAWSPNTEISDASIANPIFFPNTTTTYTLTVTDAAGCVASAQHTITVFTLPSVNAGSDATICAGESTPLGGSPTSPTATSYQWNPATGLNNATAANPTATPNDTTIYVVVVQDGNQCANSDSVTVVVNPIPALEAGPDVAVCDGSSIGLNATGSGSFLWSPSAGLNDPSVPNPTASPSNTTLYTVVLTDGNSCSSTDSLTVSVDPLPTADAGIDTWLCQGSSVVLAGSGSGNGFSWTPAASLNDPNSATPTATPNSTTMYVLTITDSNNCSSTDAVTVTVGVDPPIDAGVDQAVCGGVPVVLGGSPTSVPGSSFNWSPVIGLSDPTAANPTASPASTTTYVLTVTNDTCTSSAAVTVTISTQGQAGFNARFEPGCENLRGFFTDASTDAVAWHWIFSTGSSSDEQDTQAILPYGGASTATLVITDALGCTDTLSQLFTLGDYADLVDVSVPNVFTPNGDGENDVFSPTTDAFVGPCTSMEVFNRWGEKVFVSQGNNITWDGRSFSGDPCSAGTFFYVITVKEVTFKGSVTLVR
ncbi:MAG: gliding motility-associated C-terminal domain-containing protein [Flavobacteriales bacterium]